MSRTNIIKLFMNSLNKSNTKTLFATPNIINKINNNCTNNWTYDSVNKLTNKIKFLLNDKGIKKNDRIIYIGDNSPYWMSVYMGTINFNGIFVPIYKSQHSDVINHIIKETEPKIILYSEETLKKINNSLVSNIKSKLINIDEINYNNLEEITDLSENISDENTSIILYTSGTTGLAKGVCLNQRNLCSNISAIDKKIGENFVNSSDIYFDHLPWSHIYGLNLVLNYGMSKGATIYINDNPNNISTNMIKSNPTIICTVPKLLYSIYDKIESNKIAKILSSKPLNKLFDNIIKKKIFGTNLRFINTGGSSVSPNIINFYSNLNIPVYQGYGLSETSPLISLNCPTYNKIGSVGKILECNKVKIHNNEILVKGTNIFSGYYKNSNETNSSFDSDEYFKTGDQGYIDSQGYLFITGRCKELYKLSNGKYINPIYIENILMESEHIQQIFVYGDSKPYNIALVVTDKSEQIIWSEIKKLSKKIKKYEIPEKILIVKPFTFEDKLLTAKLSLIRNNIYKKYEKEIKNLY